MIHQVIKDRMEVVGLTQAKLAEAIDCTPTQLGLFLKGEASLNRNSLDKCFQVLGIKINAISKRIDLAKKVASSLRKSSVEDIAKMKRNEMVRLSGYNEIKSFPVVSKEEFEIMVSSGLSDYESTFQYFKALVLHLINVGEKITPKTAEASFSKLALAIAAVPLLGGLSLAAMPFVGAVSAIGTAIGVCAMKNKLFSKALGNAWGPLLTLAINIFDKEK